MDVGRETVQEHREKIHRERLARLARLRPIDDDFMRCIFRDNIPLAQMVLGILVGQEDIRVTRVETQKDLKRLVGARSLCLDTYMNDDSSARYDVEIQRSDKGAGAHRARYHASSMDIENLDAGQNFEELPDTYTIFITEKDVYKKGRAVYPIERMNLGTDELFGDGQHILYVNGAHRGDSKLGKLMHDFSCSDPDEMYFDLMKETVRYYKETEEGVAVMCREFEEEREAGRKEGREAGRKEGRKEGRLQGIDETRIADVRSLMEALQFTAIEAMTTLRIPVAEQERYLAMM